MRVFQEIGTDIENAWSAAGHDRAALPALAADILRSRRPHLRAQALDVAEWVLDAPDLPRQHDINAIFAEPPVSVYEGPQVHLQALCWLAGTTAIHRHGFVGAFVVLEGTSLHTTYEFTLRHRLSAHLQVGDLRLVGAEILRPGDVVEITPGLKHNIFHLEARAATLVVRSRVESDEPKLDYFPPSLAFDPFDVDPVLLRRVQILRFLLRSGHPRHDALARRLLERSDAATAWDVLEQSFNEIDEPGRAARLAEVARRRHGPMIDDFVAVIEEERRKKLTLRLFLAESDPELRFLLALLHSVPHRDAIFDLVSRRHAGADPRALVQAWVERLSGVDRIGVDFSDEVNRTLLAAMLEGCERAELLGRLADRFDIAGAEAALLAHADRLRQTALAPLFRRADPASRDCRERELAAA